MGVQKRVVVVVVVPPSPFSPPLSRYELVAEVQIHLRSIHLLKQENHIPYEISRASAIHELVGEHMSEVSTLKRAVANREENVDRLKGDVADLTAKLAERSQMLLQSEASLARAIRGDGSEFVSSGGDGHRWSNVA